MRYNKKRVYLLNLLIICILPRSAPQILSMKDERTFCFLFFIIGLCNYSADFLLDAFSFLIFPPDAILSKNS